eukprot:204906-Chlamydomonas_euryale.AAC.1
MLAVDDTLCGERVRRKGCIACARRRCSTPQTSTCDTGETLHGADEQGRGLHTRQHTSPHPRLPIHTSAPLSAGRARRHRGVPAIMRRAKGGAGQRGRGGGAPRSSVTRGAQEGQAGVNRDVWNAVPRAAQEGQAGVNRDVWDAVTRGAQEGQAGVNRDVGDTVPRGAQEGQAGANRDVWDTVPRGAQEGQAGVNHDVWDAVPRAAQEGQAGVQERGDAARP